MDFEALLLEIRPSLYKHALRLTQNADDAKDIVSGTMLRALRHQHVLQNEEGLRTWLFTVATNLFKDTQKCHEAKYTRNWDPERLDEIAQDTTFVDHVHDSFTRDAVLVAVNKLPETVRATVLLRFVEDLSYQQIHMLLHIPLGTARMHVHRALRQLREELSPYWIDQ